MCTTCMACKKFSKKGSASQQCTDIQYQSDYGPILVHYGWHFISMCVSRNFFQYSQSALIQLNMMSNKSYLHFNPPVRYQYSRDCGHRIQNRTQPWFRKSHVREKRHATHSRELACMFVTIFSII